MFRIAIAIATALLAALLAVCGAGPAEDPADTDPDSSADHAAFLDNLRAYCGAAYAGETELNTLSDQSFTGAELVVELDDCDGTEIRIPFVVDGDRSRTWVLTMETRGLRLRHDHRDEDGTPDEANLYGGYANEEGDATVQYFAADSATVAERPGRSINLWSIQVEPDADRFAYSLYLEDELRLRAVFDLSAPVAPGDGR